MGKTWKRKVIFSSPFPKTQLQQEVFYFIIKICSKCPVSFYLILEFLKKNADESHEINRKVII